MRKTRRFLLLVLMLSAAGVGLIYRQQRARQEREAPPKPAPLAQGLQSVKQDWVYYKGDGDRPVFEARAKEMEQVAGDSMVMHLKGVDLRLYKKDGKRYDHVESATAQFDQAVGSLFAEGEVTITLAVPEDAIAATPAEVKPPARERLLKIVTSGVHFASADGKAQTDQPARFEFDLGSGQAVGASYDPQERDLRLAKDVKLDWIGRDPTRPPMHIEANGLVYREAESKVHLLDRSHFERQTLKMDGGGALITLDNGVIRNVETGDARGTDLQPRRRLDFSAKQLKLDFNERAVIEQVLGTGATRIEVSTPAGKSLLASDQVLMQFAAGSQDGKDGGSILKDALAQGHGEFRSSPASNGGERVVHSDVIYAKMRAGGEELEQVETRAPGVLDLLPAGAGQPKRRLEAGHMVLDYAPANVMDTFRAADARTRTERPAEAGKPAPPPAITSSKDLLARFDTKTGAMTTLEQTTNFRYEEGAQRATADHAVLNQATQHIVLTGNARAWDASGQVIATRITMEQNTGRMVAEGDVVSTREPEQRPLGYGGAPTGSLPGPLLSTSAPLHGKAARMIISDRNAVIVHEGNRLQDGKPQGKAVVWQGANRIEAARVLINRAARTLSAAGEVTSIFADAGSAKGAASTAVMTTVRADKLDYTDSDRLAHYMGTVRLARPGLDVRAGQLRAYMNEDSDLDRMIADGQVNVVQAAAGRTRKSSSEHAEYFTTGEKILLSGGSPVMDDSVKGTTRGTKLAYTGADDTLVVEGAPTQPASSRLRRQ